MDFRTDKTAGEGMKLILGTAEFGHPDYNKRPSLKEIRKIFACAKEAGINIIDTAESYNCTELIRKEAKGFCIYTKTRDWKVNLNWGDNELRGILYHYQPGERKIELPFVHRWVNLGTSVYDINQLPEENRIIQVPFNIRNTSFLPCFDSHRTVFVRSVFNRGELLSTYSIRSCLQFVKKLRPDGIIVGVETVKELEEIIKAY